MRFYRESSPDYTDLYPDLRILIRIHEIAMYFSLLSHTSPFLNIFEIFLHVFFHNEVIKQYGLILNLDNNYTKRYLHNLIH